ncbi:MULTISPECIES: 4-oxalocrotonate tautomerase [Carboxydothermus]|uniref:Tautomerase n=2 Tax=Carboxydothermus TaxID=129957 RepID=Q3AE46_CARHZ|nr:MULTISPECIES: 4-oxalocrotonate tautomerase [Carboxydothermus]ABB15115.1 4-oxalocrotonate tautomerase [Carboxydothermus hydrogenoformans Z-2901]NYE56602.1 4-oxalocrotonate tautomerase [Carboxydothermus ferrireducens DSM 11255]
MPIIQIELLEGRTVEQKRELVKRITEVTVDVVKCPPEAVKIIIREMKPENYGDGGVLRADKK